VARFAWGFNGPAHFPWFNGQQLGQGSSSPVIGQIKPRALEGCELASTNPSPPAATTAMALKATQIQAPMAQLLERVFWFETTRLAAIAARPQEISCKR
jgi:hypothetical protein